MQIYLLHATIIKEPSYPNNSTAWAIHSTDQCRLTNSFYDVISGGHIWVSSVMSELSLMKKGLVRYVDGWMECRGDRNWWWDRLSRIVMWCSVVSPALWILLCIWMAWTCEDKWTKKSAGGLLTGWKRYWNMVRNDDEGENRINHRFTVTPLYVTGHVEIQAVLANKNEPFANGLGNIIIIIIIY